MQSILQNGLYTVVQYKSGVGAAVAGTVGFALLAMLIPYLLGSINTAVVISRLLYKDDIRRYGSGNAGMTNMLRTFGKKAAVLTLLGDVVKTLLAILVGGVFMGLQYIRGFSIGYGGYLAALFCILGHVFPIYYRFKGGKGVLCTATAVAALSPIAFGLLFVVFVIIVGFTKYVSLGSVMCALMYPLFLFKSLQVVMNGGTAPVHMLLISFVIAGFLVWCHRTNIGRLMRGEENKLSFKKKDKFLAENGKEDAEK